MRWTGWSARWRIAALTATGVTRATGPGSCIRACRLSIWTGGAQPFIAPGEDGGQILVANGEVYNHAALRQSLCTGYDFTSNSDCETMLALWARHGNERAAAASRHVCGGAL
jgi:asparagine synthetase B (glutamine-hydrolysing)